MAGDEAEAVTETEWQKGEKTYNRYGVFSSVAIGSIDGLTIAARGLANTSIRARRLLPGA